MAWLLLVGALGLLTVGAELLVRGGSGLALRLGLSPLFVGLTIVGVGTSSPELAASLLAAARGADDVAVGNVVGSNVFNVGAILGLTALLCPIAIRLRELRRDLAVALAAAAVPWLAPLLGGEFPRWFGGALLAALAAYMTCALRAGRRAQPAQVELAGSEVRAALAVTARGPSLPTCAALIALGLALLVFGSRLFVSEAMDLARAHGVSELVVGLTVVAAGTSMPELVTSVVAALRGSPDIAVGNVLGSNIFNVLGVLGVSAIVAPQDIAPRLLVFDVPVMVLLTALLVPFLYTGGRLSRREGALLLAGYVGYVAVLLARAI